MATQGYIVLVDKITCDSYPYSIEMYNTLEKAKQVALNIADGSGEVDKMNITIHEVSFATHRVSSMKPVVVAI